MCSKICFNLCNSTFHVHLKRKKKGKKGEEWEKKKKRKMKKENNTLSTLEACFSGNITLSKTKSGLFI